MLKHTQTLTFGLIISLLLLTGCAEDSLVDAEIDSPTAAQLAEPSGDMSAMSKKAGEFPIDITGTVNGETFEAVFTITKFKVKGDQLVAIGELSNVTGVPNKFAKRLLKAITELVVNDIFASATCDILFLELGPIHLELLGLIVDVNQIVIDIDADPAGGILGSLLCAIANLFDGGLLQDVADLLNDLLGSL